MLTDPIADFLTKIRNAAAAQKDFVETPYSNLKKAIAELMLQRGYMSDVKTEEEDGKKFIIASLNPKHTELSIKRISKPGQRIYVDYKRVKRVKNGLGLGVYSTSRGVLSDSEARKMKIGGEYICEIY